MAEHPGSHAEDRTPPDASSVAVAGFAVAPTMRTIRASAPPFWKKPFTAWAPKSPLRYEPKYVTKSPKLRTSTGVLGTPRSLLTRKPAVETGAATIDGAAVPSTSRTLTPMLKAISLSYDSLAELPVGCCPTLITTVSAGRTG